MKQLKVLLMMPDEAMQGRAGAAMQQAGISAQVCATPPEMFSLLGDGDYDAVVLDIGELEEIGYALVSRLRTSPSLGIVVVGTNLQVENRLRCLQGGADVCLMQPIDPRELVGVLMALARRLPGRAANPGVKTEASATQSHSGSWELRDQNWTLMTPTGVAISLSANERHIVRCLLEAAGQAVPRSDLTKHLDESATRANGSRSIDVIISRLRRKGELAGVNLPIRTVYGSGYLFADQ
ncbi:MULTISPECIES: response regulator transcription factor [unclassified Bordetella]|uniref:response regulator transcription factor n=1 Tax=unclassified Bordetella TaxID=2630031 RepID=UPI001328407E|nr:MULTISPECIES: response regulator transcription factor [unclassified Bordetella]MVW73434.1 response regulator [Bordetella sp. 15P40C-2]MVW80771.1 response regulator [Bordetella sp. 02P26C-1]